MSSPEALIFSALETIVDTTFEMKKQVRSLFKSQRNSDIAENKKTARAARVALQLVAGLPHPGSQNTSLFDVAYSQLHNNWLKEEYEMRGVWDFRTKSQWLNKWFAKTPEDFNYDNAADVADMVRPEALVLDPEILVAIIESWLADKGWGNPQTRNSVADRAVNYYLRWFYPEERPNWAGVPLTPKTKPAWFWFLDPEESYWWSLQSR